MLVETDISTECNWPASQVEVDGSAIHYIESGSGKPMVFLHGIPTSSYLWRNVFPEINDMAHCYAPDLIGMGHSDKPAIDYTAFDHIRYIEGFIEALELKDITLVVHGWGSLIGFEYARRHPDNVRALAFYESHIRLNERWDMVPLPVQQLFHVLDNSVNAEQAVVEDNYFLNQFLQNGVLRKLSDVELAVYQQPFQTVASRKLIWQYTQELPRGSGSSTAVANLISDCSAWLESSDLPKLMMYTVPGFITTIDAVQWAKRHLSNLVQVDLEEGLHFAQETEPQLFGRVLRQWYLENV